MLRGLFARRAGRPERDSAEARRVKSLARAILGEPEPELAVAEVDCGDPACPGLETVLLVLRPGSATRACKVAKPLAEVTEQDLRSCLEEEMGGAQSR